MKHISRLQNIKLFKLVLDPLGILDLVFSPPLTLKQT